MEITKVIRTAFISWIALSILMLAQAVWVYTRNGLDGFQAFIQDSPFTYIPLTLASAGIVWLLAGLLLWLIHTNRVTKSNLLTWVGFFIVSISYLNILRERVRYGDIGYYIEAAFNLYKHQPLPDTYLYPPLWATLLSFLTPLGEDGILIICWLANIFSLFAFYFLLHRILEHYQFNTNAAALITTLFLLVNMPLLRTLMYVQVNLHVINFIFLSILLYRDRPFLSAFFLALAIHFKTSPALLLMAFLFEFNWKWLAYFSISMVLIAFFTFAPYGASPFLDFIHNTTLLNAPREFSMRDSSFDSAISVTLSYLRVDESTVRLLVYLAKGITTLLAVILGFRMDGLYSNNENGAKIYNAIVPLMFAMTIASPLIWEHHGIFLTLPFLLLLKKIESPAEWAWFGTAYLFVFLIPAFDFFPWSYTKLIGILAILGLMWFTRTRSNNSFISKFDNWIIHATG